MPTLMYSLIYLLLINSLYLLSINYKDVYILSNEDKKINFLG